MVVVLAMDLQQTLYNGPTTGGVVSRLLSAGYSVVSLDLPCHGADALPGVQPLDCWASRIAAGDEDLFQDFCLGLSRVLNHLNVSSAAIVGVSRGAYVAATCAAGESRLRAVALLIPVTDLNYLLEFKANPVDEAMFGLDQYSADLGNRATLVRIGKDDTRVGTALAVDFAQTVGATLQLTDAVGHDTAEDGSTITWLLAHPF